MHMLYSVINLLANNYRSLKFCMYVRNTTYVYWVFVRVAEDSLRTARQCDSLLSVLYSTWRVTLEVTIYIPTKCLLPMSLSLCTLACALCLPPCCALSVVRFCAASCCCYSWRKHCRWCQGPTTLYGQSRHHLINRHHQINQLPHCPQLQECNCI